MMYYIFKFARWYLTIGLALVILFFGNARIHDREGFDLVMNEKMSKFSFLESLCAWLNLIIVWPRWVFGGIYEYWKDLHDHK